MFCVYTLPKAIDGHVMDVSTIRKIFVNKQRTSVVSQKPGARDAPSAVLASLGYELDPKPIALPAVPTPYTHGTLARSAAAVCLHIYGRRTKKESPLKAKSRR